MEISSIGQIAVTVHDLDRATGFYRDLLNLKHLFSFPRLSFFQCGGVRLMLTIPEKPEFDHPSSISLRWRRTTFGWLSSEIRRATSCA